MIDKLRAALADLPPTARRATLIVAALLVAIIVIVAYKGFTGGETDEHESARPEETTFPTMQAPSSSAPVALPPGMGTTTPPGDSSSTSSSARPSATETPEAEAVIDALSTIEDPQEWASKFAVLWNSFTPAGGRHDQWQSNVNAYCTTDGKRLLDKTASTVWTGAIMNSSTVRPTSEPRARRLWQVDDASMWRVSTPISIASTDPAYAAADGTSRTTWDFYIRKNNNTYLLDSYAEPTPANENPNSYTPAR